MTLVDLPRQPGMIDTVADCFAQTADTFLVSDEILPVEVSQFGMGVVGLGALLNVSGNGIAGTACMHDVVFGITHRQECFCRGTIAVNGFL